MIKIILLLLSFFAFATRGYAVPDWTAPLRAEAQTLGKPEWRPMLNYLAGLHARATRPATPPFEFPWENIGPGYSGGAGFGHIDNTHEILDVLPMAPEHARQQLLNNIRLQLENGMLPGVIWVAEGKKPSFNREKSYPPLWIFAADDYLTQTQDRALAREFYDRAARQYDWFEKNRRAQPEGYYYLDVLRIKWESGVDEGVRYDGTPPGRRACIDATAHVYLIADALARWAPAAGADPKPWTGRADALRRFIQTRLWDDKDGFFYDTWAIENPALRHQSFEGFWPLTTGAATPEQARRIIDEWMLREDRFFAAHPLTTVSQADPKFELRMWRGPAWNSMTYWAARGCVRYGRRDAARRMLEAALDDTARQFARTGTIWEFFDPRGGPPEKLARKPGTERPTPCADYIGHNPLFAMARLWAGL